MVIKMKGYVLYPLIVFILIGVYRCNAENNRIKHEPKLVFMKNNNIYLTNLYTVKPERIAKGIFPKISPDGGNVVFTASDDMIAIYSCKTKSVRLTGMYFKDFTEPDWSSDGESFIFCPREGKLAIYSIKNGSIQTLSRIPGEDFYDPKWSPDGKKIAFIVRVGTNEEIGVINKNGTGFKIISDCFKGNHKDYFQLHWSRQGRSVIFHDRKFIYEMDLQGKLLHQWSIDRIIKPAMFYGEYLVTDDQKSWICCIGADDEAEYPLWKEKRRTIYRYDIASGKRVRLLPKGMFVSSMDWMPDRKGIIFGGETKTNSSFDNSIYTLSIPEGKLRKVVAGKFPSCSR